MNKLKIIREEGKCLSLVLDDFYHALVLMWQGGGTGLPDTDM